MGRSGTCGTSDAHHIHGREPAHRTVRPLFKARVFPACGGGGAGGDGARLDACHGEGPRPLASPPGQEGGHAIAAVLTGEAEPTGRLVTTYPEADGATPAWNVTPGDDFGLDYTDGTAIGYRGYHAGHAPAPLYWFGHGLGYGSWEYGAARLAPQGDAAEAPTVEAELTNTSARPSRETVQVYFAPADSAQPVRLAGYTGVDVPAGASVTVTVACDRRLFCRWDEAAHAWASLTGGELLVARGLGDIRAQVPLS
ncbi:glycoside hydrolase family 3 C-terminal domain-containing protein [Streptomyces sp. NBC_00117]|uniref:glycoside hydrolase family 3 C-terminal domain-containing protein n=1 Tax=Streptomyces sp. NBC_00117 TaxID=2975657 RepID=UPI003251CC8D